MCYPKPGPRCSAHARKDLVRNREAAQKAYAAGDEETFNELVEQKKILLRNYYTTPAGIDHLKKLHEEAVQNGNGEDADKLKKIYERANTVYENQITAYRLKTKMEHSSNFDKDTEALVAISRNDEALQIASAAQKDTKEDISASSERLANSAKELAKAESTLRVAQRTVDSYDGSSWSLFANGFRNGGRS